VNFFKVRFTALSGSQIEQLSFTSPKKILPSLAQPEVVTKE